MQHRIKRLLSVSLLGMISMVTAATNHDLVDVATVVPNVKLDIHYATTNNFTKQLIYRNFRGKTYLRKEVTDALARVAQDLEKQGLGLLIWDAYRPVPAQWVLWEVCPDPRYVGDPRQGRRHTRGTAVDCTLCRLEGGQLLEMPTEFDDFTERAWRSNNDLSHEVIKNRACLEEAMVAHGFVGLKTEWWHYDYHTWQQCDPLDIDFDQLA